MSPAAIAGAAFSMLAGGETPVPQEGAYPDAEVVTPGTLGFLATFFVAVAVVLLARNLIARQRRMRARAGVVRHHAIPVEREPRRRIAAESEVGGAAGASEPGTSGSAEGPAEAAPESGASGGPRAQ
ncbi:hypothetical protein [Brevibacterium album]|uniref:hypothetical protein n=1 Tax=Brevibacterium album TaxID=417948 RepID=UPI0004270273|nr:hypothetical protein [Brevibacterium album]